MPDIPEKQQIPDDKLFFGGKKESNDVHDIHHVHQIDLSLAIDANAEGLNNAKGIIDKALIESSANPGALGRPEFAEAIRLVSANQSAWFEYRSKIKSMKPSGVPMADIDAMVTGQSANGDKQDSAAAELIELVMSQGTLFYDSQADKAFLSIEIKEIEHTLAIGSKAFIDWLSYSYYTTTKARQFGWKVSE